jgi:MoaA/NifB/PqqE/SkfB family radical SAM enzyme
MRLNNLVLEITRRCNMKCEHCMRGSAQRVDMSNQTLWNTLKDIDSINTLTITGGEPQLKPEAIIELWNILISRGINVDSCSHQREDHL